MGITRRASLLLASAAMTLTLIPHGAQAAGCPTPPGPLVAKTAANANGDQNSVDTGKVNVYTRTFGAGDHYVALVSPGDIDIVVCKVTGSTSTQVCKSDNMGGVDGCLGDEAEGNPGIGDVLHGAGTYKIYVRHCMNLECGYPADAPALPYVIAWA